jgi:hypothetical protein
MPTAVRERALSRTLQATVTTNVKGGVILGFVISSLYSLYAVILYAIRGSAAFEANGVTMAGIVAAYYGAGIIGGAIVGALSPLLRWRLGATVVGMVAGFVVFVGIGLATEGYFTRWTNRTWETAVVLGTFFGAVCANIVWRRPNSA